MKNTKRFLITTALEESWRYDEPILFLGEWCRLYSRKEHWDNLDADVLTYHWADKSKLDRDCEFLSSYYEQLLIILAQKLNEIHNTDFSLRYWRILVGPWLAYFIQMLFDRWESVHQAIELYELDETVLLEYDETLFIPNDMNDFVKLFVEDSWNHGILGIILNQFTTIRCIIKKPSLQARGMSLPITQSRKDYIKQKLIYLPSKVISLFAKDPDIFLNGTYLPVKTEIKLQIKLGQFPQLWENNIKTVRIEPDLNKRNWVLKSTVESSFDTFVNSLIPKHIPTAYLEGFSSLVEQTKNLGWPKNPKIIFTSNILWHDCVSMAYTAEKVENGSLLVYGQHGGFYGSGKFSWAEKHEIAISDFYLSWGWDEIKQSKIIPLGILKSFGKHSMGSVSLSKTRTKTLLLVLVSISRYSYRLDSDLNSGEMIKSFEEHFSFVRTLPMNIKNQVLVRLHVHEYGWFIGSRWKDQFSDIMLDDGTSNMERLMRNCRILVYTYNSTGYLESLSLNIPTIIFWNSYSSPLRDSAVPYFEELKKAGIFHETPGSAAAKVAEIWEDVPGWWNQPQIQRARENFCNRFARTLKNPTKLLKDILLSVKA